MTDGLDFEAVEQAARRQALRVAARAVERRLNADRSDYQGSTVSCACGQTARYAGRRPKTLTSALGSLTLERAYYHCDACHAGVCPRDRALGVQDTSLSPATTRMVGHAAASVSAHLQHRFDRRPAHDVDHFADGPFPLLQQLDQRNQQLPVLRQPSVDTQIRPVCPAGHTLQYDQRRVMTSDRRRSGVAPDVAGVGVAVTFT